MIASGESISSANYHCWAMMESIIVTRQPEIANEISH